MSEHSVSFHVRCDRVDHAVEWLQASHALGLVIPKVGQFVTVLVPEHHTGPAIAANKFTLVYYEFLGDERVTVRLYNGPNEVAHLERSFELGTTKFDPKPWINLRVIDRAQAKVLQKRLAAAWPEGVDRHWVADVLGLHAVAWSAGDELIARRDDLVARYPGSILVEAHDPALDPPRRGVSRTTPAPAVPVVASRTATPAVLVAPLPGASGPMPRSPSPTPPTAPTAVPPPAPVPMPSSTTRSTSPTPPAPVPPSSPPPAPPTPRAPLPPPTRAPSPPALPEVRFFTPTAAPPPEPEIDLGDDDDEQPAPVRRPRSLSVLDEVDFDDTPAPQLQPPPPPRAPEPRIPRQPAHTPSDSLYAHLPLSDPFTDEPLGHRPPSEAPATRSVVLCTLTKQRRKVIGDDPKLVDAFLDARFEEEIPGMLDLGARAGELAMILATIGRDLPEALYATKARPIPRTNARVLDKADVVRIAAELRRIDPNDASTICRDPRIAADLRELITLYTEAAQRGHAILVAIE